MTLAISMFKIFSPYILKLETVIYNIPMKYSKCHDASIFSLERITSCMLTKGIILAIGVYTLGIYLSMNGVHSSYQIIQKVGYAGRSSCEATLDERMMDCFHPSPSKRVASWEGKLPSLALACQASLPHLFPSLPHLCV